MTFPLWGYVGIGSLLLGFGAGWQVNEWRHDAAALKAERKAAKKTDGQRAKVHEESTNYENDREQSRQQAEQREGWVREIYRTVEVPASCEPPADAGSLLDNAIRDANTRAGSEPGG